MTKRINLALQGGGAHGAFTWGALDRILEDEDIEIAAISGTSAGALNGAALKAGLVRGGRTGARENLDWLWGRVGASSGGVFGDWLQSLAPTPAMFASALGNSAQYALADATMRMLSPYAYGPFYRNPLTSIVDHFDFASICAGEGPRFFVGATSVRTGKIRVFSGDEITTDAILASACLPTLFQAVEIDGEPYWDGGYAGNPPLFPLYETDLPDDILVIQINPLVYEDTPRSAMAIQNRINEISFNASLLRDLRAINFVKRLIADGTIRKGAMKDVLVHMIVDDALMNALNVATKVSPTPALLGQLKAAGRLAADAFLARHKDDLNERATVDLRAMFA
ncbi:patatin-like phospholipase family protein [Anianabacter salinae]|uniref:patatin-like phospholipase family protein n=1 Tax=Anianabacter salinae TaxID=2851023 RepID=UPI00225E2957|nr:patatin-like phospholipase family protein [Anianabacter salinae]MBV0912143.1 patatin-like phospholipase family protein [Anianabacter salinae]